MKLNFISTLNDFILQNFIQKFMKLDSGESGSNWKRDKKCQPPSTPYTSRPQATTEASRVIEQSCSSGPQVLPAIPRLLRKGETCDWRDHLNHWVRCRALIPRQGSRKLRTQSFEWSQLWRKNFHFVHRGRLLMSKLTARLHILPVQDKIGDMSRYQSIYSSGRAGQVNRWLGYRCTHRARKNTRHVHQSHAPAVENLEHSSEKKLNNHVHHNVIHVDVNEHVSHKAPELFPSQWMVAKHIGGWFAGNIKILEKYSRINWIKLNKTEMILLLKIFIGHEEAYLNRTEDEHGQRQRPEPCLLLVATILGLKKIIYSKSKLFDLDLPTSSNPPDPAEINLSFE